MLPYACAALPRPLSVVLAAITCTMGAAPSLACAQRPATAATSPPITWQQLHRMRDGSIEAYLGAADVGFTVFLQQADDCRTTIVRAVSESDVVTVYRGPEVRKVMPLGGAVPPVPDSVRLDTAISGSIHCDARTTPGGEIKITLRLENIQLKDAIYAQIGPVEVIPGIPPP